MEEEKDFEAFLQKELGLKSSELKGKFFVLKKHIGVKIIIKQTIQSETYGPEQSRIDYICSIKNGTKIKILYPCCSKDFYSVDNDAIIEILEPQIIFGEDESKIFVKISDLIEAIK